MLSIRRRANLWGDQTAVVDVSEARRDAPASTVDETRISYAELAALADRAATGLATDGIGAGDVVCVVSRNRIASIALFFACHRLGVTFAPISHRSTPATVGDPIDRIDPDLVVYEPAQRDLIRALSREATATFDDVVVDESTGVAPETATASEDGPLCYLHDDGGSPVVAFSRETVERNCIASAATWGLGRTDRVPLFLPLSTFDGLFRVTLPLLYVGGTILLDRAFDPGDALEAIRQEDATLLVGRAVEFRELAARGFDDGLESVSRAISETSVDEEIHAAFRERGVPLTRARGFLECPNALTEPSAGVDETRFQPVLGCEARLVDDGVVEGVAEGRLQLSGPVVADGYVSPAGTGDGDDTADSSGDRDGGAFVDGWFETGERFRRSEDGRYAPS